MAVYIPLEAYAPGLWIIGGAVLVGILIGVPFVLIRRRVKGSSGFQESFWKSDEPSAATPLTAVRVGLTVTVVAGLILGGTCSPVVDGWLAFAPLAALLCAVLFVAVGLALRGRARATRGLVEMAICLPLVAWASCGALAFVNQRTDASMAQLYQVHVVDKNVTRHRSGVGRRSYRELSGEDTVHVWFESWRGDGLERFRVRESLSGVARIGDIWALRVRGGALGYPWVEDMRPRR